MRHVRLVREIPLLGLLLLLAGPGWRRSTERGEFVHPTTRVICSVPTVETLTAVGGAVETVDPEASGFTPVNPSSSPPDFILLPPSTMVIVRGGLRHFFWRWSDVRAFARPKETLNLFATKIEVNGFWEHIKHFEDAGVPSPEEMHILTYEQWTLDQVYVRLEEPLPEGPQDSVRDIISRLNLNRSIDGPVFNLDERDPDRY